MRNVRPNLVRGIAIAGAITAAILGVQTAHAQWSREDLTRLQQIDPGTFITIRTEQSIASDRADGRVFPARVAEDVWDDYSRLAVPAIPEGSPAELVVRTARDGDLMLDLDSVIAHGQRYVVSAQAERIQSDGQLSNNAPALIGGGAVLGTIIGAIAGGGKGAAIGAAAGAATGAGLSIRGRSVRVPAGSVLNFRLDRPLVVGVPRPDHRRFDRSAPPPLPSLPPPPPPPVGPDR